MNPILKHLWAKSDPFHPLPCHLIDVGNVALALLNAEPFRSTALRFATATGCPPDQTAVWLAYIVSLHDLGKCHLLFQAKGPAPLLDPLIRAGLLDGWRDEPFRHEAVSAQWVRRHLKNDHGWQPSSALTVAAALKAHHGNFHPDAPDPETEAQEARWEPLRHDLANLLWHTFSPGDWKAGFHDHSVAGILLCGLLVLSDWIASNRELFPISHGGEPLDQYATRSHDLARKAVSRLGFDGRSPWSRARPFTEVWPGIDRPNGLQRCMERLCRSDAAPGLAIIEAPMGEGKTEAAIYLATQWMAASGQTGFYMALPTAATSNQMYGRLTKFLARHDPLGSTVAQLVHGTSWMLDSATPERMPELGGDLPSEAGIALDWFRPRKRTLLAPYGVGTIDQAHMSVLHVPFCFLRLFGLAGKVLIVDEVHAYDAYMSEFLEHLLRWCSALAVPVILLSATLPAGRREALARAYSPGVCLNPGVAPYPLITLVGRDGTVREESGFETASRLPVRLIQHKGLLGMPDRIAEVVADAARRGGCIGVIANTITSAQSIYDALHRRLDGSDTELLLFHARFPAGRRQELEDAVLERLDKRSLLKETDEHYRPRPRRLVLVATQVVEQSLDLDFDELFTELAPIDLILQRMGRLWRHDRPERHGRKEPSLHLLLPDGPDGALGPSGTVYNAFILRRTYQVLEGRMQITLPGDLRELVRRVYDDPPHQGSPLWTEYQQLQAELEEARRQAQVFIIPDPKPSALGLANFHGLARDENEGDAASYLAVRTRQGDYTRSILALEGEAFADLLAAPRPPCRETLKEIYLRAVDVPAWWLSSVEARPGYFPLQRAPDWLPGHTVLRLCGGRWEGVTAAGEPFAIVNDPILGMKRTSLKGVWWCGILQRAHRAMDSRPWQGRRRKGVRNPGALEACTRTE